MDSGGLAQGWGYSEVKLGLVYRQIDKWVFRSEAFYYKKSFLRQETTLNFYGQYLCECVTGVQLHD